MSFIKINKDLLENTSITLRPRVHFVSSSAGITGSSFVSPFRSKTLKDAINPAVLGSNSYDPQTPTNPGYDESDYAVIEFLDDAKAFVRLQESQGINSSDISGYMDSYLSAINDTPERLRNAKTVNVFNFQMGTNYIFNKEVIEKNNIRKVLMPYHRVRYEHCGMEYTNYNCLNFYTASNVPTGSCLIYSNNNDSETDLYGLDGEFTFSFWINPRYTNDSPSAHFKAGTIFHSSSSFCLSLVSGSSRDKDDLVDGYRLLLQLSSSADKSPSEISYSESLTYPHDLIFSSSNNSLKRNNWHHVAIKWGTTSNNSGTGSIIIDGNSPEYFVVPSSSVYHNTEAVFLGNYYLGESDNIPNFFNNAVANPSSDFYEGVYYNPAGTDSEQIDENTFSHPLNAEVHDFKIYSKYLTDDAVASNRNKGVTSYENLLFYVPPFFTPESPHRNVLTTPFQPIESTTNDPFNVSFSFGVGGKLINLENFTREFVKGNYPRHYNLTASFIDYTIEDLNVDDYTYASGSIIKRNFTVLPCDNGLFKPDFFPLVSGSDSARSMFKNSMNNLDYSIVNINELIPTGTLFQGLVFQSGSILDDIMGASPENPGVAAGSVLTIAQRTRDTSSNLITIFDISNLYYGNRIHPGTFESIDENLTGSDGKISIKLKDNGRGSLYRADSATAHAQWSNCGNIFYDEGIIIVKSPHIFNYSKDKTDISFRGEQDLHVFTINTPCPQGMFNSSSNPQYNLLSASNNQNDQNSDFVYVSNINIHDDNMNVIMRANLAQPVTKRFNDSYLFKLKYDF
jgi:hypothetical protein